MLLFLHPSASEKEIPQYFIFYTIIVSLLFEKFSLATLTHCLTNVSLLLITKLYVHKTCMKQTFSHSFKEMNYTDTVLRNNKGKTGPLEKYIYFYHQQEI